jgi:hypothetical protein
MGIKKSGVLRRFSQFFFEKSNFKIGLLALAIFSGFLGFLSWIGKSFEVEGGKVKSLGTTFGFGFEDVKIFFAERSDIMLTSYINFNQIWDIIFAIIYGFMYVIWLSVIYKPYSEKIWLLNLLPLTQVIFDWVENFCLAALTKSYLAEGIISTTTTNLASSASIMKWVISGFVYLLIVYGVALRLFKKF